MKIGIVDPYSTGSQLCERLYALNIELAHIDSGLEVPNTMREHYHPDIFSEMVVAEDLVASDDVRATLESFDWIIAGSESGVSAANSLALHTSRPMFFGSPPSKLEVVKLLDSAGLKAPRTRLLTNTTNIDSQLQHFAYPVVVKPLWSATGDGVKLCRSREAVLTACESALQRPNIYGVQIDAVLLQEFLPGDEFYCNLVSSNGNHAAIEVWRYTKRQMPDGGWVYSSEDYIPLSSNDGTTVADYCCDVLRAIGLSNGATHLEVMVDQGEATLVEANYRLGGATASDAIDEVAGASQVRAFADLLSGVVQDVTQFNPISSPNRCMRNIFLYPVIGGLMRNGIDIDFRNLESARAVELHTSTNERDTESSLLSSPGFVLLAADNPTQLALAEEQVRHLEGVIDV